MLPAGPLMIEHRIIERMVALMNNEQERIISSSDVDIAFMEKCIYFLRVYADRCHHGKEEDILFRDLDKKELSPEHRQIMNELIDQHAWARKRVQTLSDLIKQQKNGKDAAGEIAGILAELADFYPAHIKTEDKNFFLPAMDYFSENEKDAMLLEFREFDTDLLHQLIKEQVKGWEESRAGKSTP